MRKPIGLMMLVAYFCFPDIVNNLQILLAIRKKGMKIRFLTKSLNPAKR